MYNLFGKDLCTINIDIDKVYILHNSVNDKGAVEKKMKYMSLDEFISAIKNVNTSLATPILPKNCLSYSKSGNNQKFLFFSPSEKITLSFRTGSGSNGVRKFDNAFFPSFIMSVSFNNGMGYSYIYMVDSNIQSSCDLNNNTPLYRMPFPNIYGDGKICWGSNFGSDMVITPRNSGILPDIFKTSVFNYDLFGTPFSEISRSMGVNNAEDYFEHLTKITEWPSSVMTPAGLNLGAIL